MKKLLTLISVVIISVSSFGQETALKKKVFYVDEVAELSLESCKAPKMEGQTCVVKSVKTGDPLFSTYIYNAGSTGYMVDISFVDFNEELRTKGMTLKKIFSLMYDMKVVEEDGTINVENATKFSRAYDIVKDRKVIISE